MAKRGVRKKETIDQPIVQGRPEDLSVIEAVRRFRKEAEDAKIDRLRKNEINRDVYFGRQDWSHKQAGQSAEFLPKVSAAVEQMAAFIKRGLIQFGDWFQVDLDKTLDNKIDGAQVRAIMKPFLNNLWAGNQVTIPIPIIISDCVKLGLLESLMIAKVHGGMMRKHTFEYNKEDKTLDIEEGDEWRLRIDLVRSEDYYPDPTGNGLYEIHRVERDLHEVVAAAEDGLYDMEAVKQLIAVDYPKPDDEHKRKDSDRNQPETIAPSFRKRVLLEEFWGTLLNEDGTVAHRNVVCTIANDRYLIRKPEPNPFWHGESPFVVAPLIRVPFSVWHKAVYDQACDLNISINEIFNLILDGGLASVWGVKQLRLEDLEDPSQVAGGLQQGMTLAVKQTLPHNAKVVETVATGDIPNEAMVVFEALNREFAASAMTNELKMGQMPPKKVLATEIVEASQSSAVTLDGIVADIETTFMTPMLRKAWLTILQNADDLPAEVMESVTDKQVALLIMRASPEERFAMFAGKSQFTVYGLSASMARAMDFQKLIAALQFIQTNPPLALKFMQKFSSDKTLRRIFRILNINPDDIIKSSEEEKNAGSEMQDMQAFQAMMGGGQQKGSSAPSGPSGAPISGSEVPSEINQAGNPLTGMPSNA